MSYLCFVPAFMDPTNPEILGAMPVPPCFAPNERLVWAANDLGLEVVALDLRDVPAELVEAGLRLFDTVTGHANDVFGAQV